MGFEYEIYMELVRKNTLFILRELKEFNVISNKEYINYLTNNIHKISEKDDMRNLKNISNILKSK